jgi:RNA polymerase sigma-70 factor (ECF subfamily)
MPSALPRAKQDPACTFDTAALSRLRADLLRFAQLQLRNPEASEDVVQESIEAALRHGSSFAGESSLKTWVFAILRNRIVDHLRQGRRTVPVSSLVEDGDDWREQAEALFNERGMWRDASRPAAWPDPEQAALSRQFWRVFEICLEQLPDSSGRAFMMREFLGLETDEICAHLRISITNCHVLLHRARLKLRGCIESGWGRNGVAEC